MVEPVVEALLQLLNLQRASLRCFIKFPHLKLFLSINNLNKLTRKAGPARSLSKNFDNLEEILNS